jgi:ParB/RepB/Spo0J family partition protein
MTDDPGNIPPAPPTTGIENNQTRIVPVNKVAVDGPRRSLDDSKVAELKQSITCVGILNPIVVVPEDGGENVRLIAGLHRLVAAKQLGLATIRCTVLECDDARRVELAEIDENLIRNDPGPAEHALLTGRRAEIIKELAAQGGALSQTATPSKKQAQRGAGQKSGPDVASVRDQANRTGETKDTVQRSRKRFEGIGDVILKKIVDTSLDKGVQLDALAKLSKEKQYDLAERAAVGETVSARMANRKPKREPQHQSRVTDLQQAMDDFYAWHRRYNALWKEKGLEQVLNEILDALIVAVCDADPSFDEPISELVTAKSKFQNWLKGRKGD